jgi:Uma2 family endonuclease
MSTATAALTPNDLVELELPDGVKQYELSDGELIPVGTAFALHELIKTAIFGILTEYRLRMRSGMAFADSMFTLRADRARIPDVAWVSNERFAQIPWENRAIPIAPDIAIEILSDSERQQAADKKLRDYLEAGVEVWQIFPATTSAIVWQGNRGMRLTGEDTITSEKLPDFSVSVSDLFRL